MATETSFGKRLFKDQTALRTTAMDATTAPIPVGKRLIVEHIFRTSLLITEHLLLAVPAEEEGVGAKVLVALGLAKNKAEERMPARIAELRKRRRSRQAGS